MICAICRAVLTEAAEWEPLYNDDCYSGTFAHHSTIQSLKASLDEKCFICISFWSKLAPVEQQTLADTHGLSLTDDDASKPMGIPGLTSVSITGSPGESFEVCVVLGHEALDRVDGRSDYGVFRVTQGK